MALGEALGGSLGGADGQHAVVELDGDVLRLVLLHVQHQLVLVPALELEEDGAVGLRVGLDFVVSGRLDGVGGAGGEGGGAGGGVTGHGRGRAGDGGGEVGRTTEVSAWKTQKIKKNIQLFFFKLQKNFHRSFMQISSVRKQIKQPVRMAVVGTALPAAERNEPLLSFFTVSPTILFYIKRPRFPRTI